MEILELIGKLILAIIIFFVIASIWGLLMSWFSNLTNSNISYRGKIIHRPHHFEETKEGLKNLKIELAQKSKEALIKLKSYTEKKMSIAEKIKALQELEELRKAGTISEEDYNKFKSKLLT